MTVPSLIGETNYVVSEAKSTADVHLSTIAIIL